MKKLTALIIGISCSILFGGCGLTKRPTTGGVVDKSDKLAPKSIKSKEIVSLSTCFCIEDSIDEEKSGEYTFKITTDDSGVSLLTMEKGDKYSAKISAEELLGLQEIIDRYNLVSKNGTDRITSALPPPYSPMSIYLTYESGETLSYRVNGDPDCGWTDDIKDYLTAILIRAGHEELKPSKEAYTINCFTVAYEKEGIYTEYSIMKTTDNVDVLYRRTRSSDEINYAYAEINDELYEGLQDIIVSTGADKLSSDNSSRGQKNIGFFELCVDYMTGRQIFAQFTEDDMPQNRDEILNAITDYLNEYINSHTVQIKE